MSDFDVPSGDRLDDVTWSMTEGGHSFWSYVDSQSSFNGARCRNGCDPKYGSDTCDMWVHQRNEMQCIALNSSNARCSQWVKDGTPFCHFHFKRAWEALYVKADREQKLRFERFTATQRLAMEAEVQRLLALELEQLYDRTHAAKVEYVYFFLAQHAVKVGRSIHPEVRVRSLGSTHCPPDVDPKTGVLLGTILGGSRVEGELHKRFAAHRLKGEWFTYADIAADIDALLAEATSERAA